MKILVANLGSTSFKYRLFDLTSETQLARGSIDRIGQPASACVVEIDAQRQEIQRQIDDHAQAVDFCLQQLTWPGESLGECVWLKKLATFRLTGLLRKLRVTIIASSTLIIMATSSPE